METTLELPKKSGLRPTLFALAAAWVLMFIPTFRHLAAYGWDAADYTHAWFILPISLYLIYRQRKSLVLASSLAPSGLALLAFGVLTYLFSASNGFMFLEAFSFCLVTWGLFRIEFDVDSFRAALFPLLYLLFLVPPPQLAIDLATFPLKQISTFMSYALLKAAHIPVKVYGAILEVGHYKLFVADACSGFRSMVTLLSLGALYAKAQRAPRFRKWVLFLSVIPIGIAANVLRIALTGVISHFFGHQYAEGFFHEFSGIVMFVIAIGGLVLVSERWVRRGHA